MNSTPSSYSWLYRCRIITAAFLGVSSLVLFGIGLGISNLLPLPKQAVAESAQADAHGLPQSVLSRERAMRLQSAVDSAALSLGSVFYEAGLAAANGTPQDAEIRQSALARALSALTFGLEGEVYFTAWQGTRVVHSPLAPDAEDMDFAHALDQRGSAFVLRMEDAARAGGGFVQVTLPRQMAPQHKQDGRVVREMDSLVSGAISMDEPIFLQEEALVGPAGRAQPEMFTVTPFSCPVGEKSDFPCKLTVVPPAESLDATPVEQVVYVRTIPQSDWHIAAFMPVAPEGSALRDTRELEGDFRKGLYVSGLSLAGLAGLMLAPGRERVRRRTGQPRSDEADDATDRCQTDDPAAKDGGSR